MTSRTFRVVACSGSLRHDSLNTAVLRLAMRLAPPELEVEYVDWLDELPWMNPDLEHDPPAPVQRWWDTVRGADALLMAMPEYNLGPTPLAKNALDWATRPPDDRAIAGTVVAFLSAAGRSGGSNAQEKYTLILPYLGATVVDEPHVRLSSVAGRIAPDGTTADAEIVDAVQAKLAALLSTLAAGPAAG